MRPTRKSTMFAALAALVLLGGTLFTAASAATVEVLLTDKGAEMGVVEGHGIGMPADGASMAMEVKPASVKAGRVEFAVTNASKETVHELIVAPLADPATPL